MSKAMKVILWLGLAGCAILMISLFSRKNALEQDWQKALRQNETLQALYDQSKEKWAAEEEKLSGKIKDLEKELEQAQKSLTEKTEAEQRASDALSQARQEWETQRQAVNAERETVSGQLSSVLALLSEPLMDAVPATEGTDGNLFALPYAAPRKPAHPPLPGEMIPFTE